MQTEQSQYGPQYLPIRSTQRSAATAETRLVLIAVADLSRSLDVAALVDVFTEADRLAKKPAYNVQVVSTIQRPVNCANPHLIPSTAFENVQRPIDTFVVAGSDHVDHYSIRSKYKAWLHHTCSLSRRVVAIGAGTLTLAAAGLLDGRKAVTHWSLHEQLKHSFPRVLPEQNVLYTQDENFYTCAGAIAGIDLALRLVEDDLSGDIAASVANKLLLHFRRTGDSSQVSLTLQAQTSSSDPISRLLGWLPDNLTKQLTVPVLARRVAMSPRNFARRFREQVGITPAKHIEGLRLEAAQRELANKRQTVAKAAELSGCTNTETLRRMFLRHLGLTPAVFQAQRMASSYPRITEDPC